MTIVDFYKAVSRLLEEYREGKPRESALRTLRELNEKARSQGMEVSVSEDVLKQISSFDDENSYDEEGTESSYESDEDSSYED